MPCGPASGSVQGVCGTPLPRRLRCGSSSSDPSHRGGGSEVSNIEKYFINFFGLNIKIQNKNTLEKDDSLEKNFASCLGAIKIIKDGWETEALPELETQSVIKTGFFAKIFGINK